MNNRRLAFLKFAVLCLFVLFAWEKNYASTSLPYCFDNSFFYMNHTLFADSTKTNLTATDSANIDTTKIITSINDSVSNDSIITDSANIKKREGSLSFPVDYSATDSIILFGNGNITFHKDGVLVYKEGGGKEVKAEFISANLDSNFFHAIYLIDSAGNKIGKPVFKDGGQSYEADEINYNFKTEKGFIRGAKTQEGEGYIISDKTKKTAEGHMNMKDGKYTTCNDLEHPHFYLNLTRGKVKPGGYVAAGPAYMVVEDVPLPLILPFGFFPFTSKYSSGIIMPSYGDELSNGFFLRNGGYYFALSDYFDVALTGDIYTKGTWKIQLESSYTKRYKFSGNINVQYNNRVTGEKDFPDYSAQKDFSIQWSHRQDPKASAFSSFSASVDFKTTGFNRNEVENTYNPAQQSQAQSNSSVNYSYRFPETPFTLSTNGSVGQNMRDSTLNLTIPNVRLDMSTIYPLKRKNRVGKERFYEKFAFSYTFEFGNSIYGKQTKVFNSSISKDWQNGIQHTPKVSLPLTIFKYINVTPSFSYTERWYFKKINQDWNTPTQRVEYDTVSGFYRVYNFSTGISVQTKFYGFYSPIKKIRDAWGIGDIRHVVTPRISFTYTPDFSDLKWKMYSEYQKTIIDPSSGDITAQDMVKYSPFANSKYGVPSGGKQQSLSFGFDNNIEMKIKDKLASDTSDNVIYKKVSIIDQLSLGSYYNFAADSMNLGDINASLRVKVTKSYSISLSTTFENYMYGLDSKNMPVRINQLRMKHGKAPWFTGTSVNFSYTLNNNTFKKKNKQDQKQDEDIALDQDGNPIDGFNLDPTQQQQQHNNDSAKSLEAKVSKEDEEGYRKPDFQWSLSLNLGVAWGKTPEFDFKKMEYKRDFTNGMVSVSGFINPTKNWSINYSASIQLLKEIKITSLTFNLSRDLHCWKLTASVTPFGYYQSFMVTIGANAAMLRDLKYDKHKKDNIVWK